MFDMGSFGSSFRGGPLNGFDAMVMSECEQRHSKASPAVDLDTMISYLFACGYLDIKDLDNCTPETIQDMYNHYK